MNRGVVYILSSNFSGSHFLSLMLGSHSRFVHLGELKNLVKRSRPCATCGDAAACALVRELDMRPGADLYAQIFQRLPDAAVLLVDASKKPDWFRARDRAGAQGVHRIHLLRDPRALARRWLLHFADPHVQRRERIKMLRRRPAAALPLLFGDMLEVYIRKWLRQNQEISAYLAHSGGPRILVTYEEIARDPAAALARINARLGCEFEPGQQHYWRFSHHGTEKSEYQWVKRQQNSFFDLRWQEFLSAEQQRRITGNRALRRYLETQGLAFGDQGLVRR
ncbi:MAG: hypothetical protein ACOY42_12065 [Pseudomonadota bacterium]